MKNENKKINQDLDELLEIASGDNTTDEIVEKPKKSIVTKVIIGAVVVVAITTIALILSTLRFNRTEVDDINVDGDSITTAEEVWERMEFPVEIPRWTRQPYEEEKFFNNEEYVEEMHEWVQMTGFGYVAASLPSGRVTDDDVPPYTNDVSKAENEDGTFNEYYSYVLQEDYERAFALTVHRLLNPHFGGWTTAQYTIDDEDIRTFVTKELFEDLFDPQWWIDNIDNGNEDKMPIYADWNGDNYGGIEFRDEGNTTGRFFGVVDESESPIEAIDLRKDMSEELRIKTIIPVKFVAFGKGDDLIEKKGTLTLVLGPNRNEKDLLHRVVAYEAKLEVK